jgi:hypothetical protein
MQSCTPELEGFIRFEKGDLITVTSVLVCLESRISLPLCNIAIVTLQEESGELEGICVRTGKRGKLLPQFVELSRAS